MTLVDDQSGVLPIREWLQAWAREWRRALGHSHGEAGPPRVRRRNPGIVQSDELCTGCGRSDGFHRWWCTSSSVDPVVDEWESRWPDTGWGPITHQHHAYLSTWLPTACDQMPRIGDFAASLRTLTGAVRAALGDVEDLEYLGRCPEDTKDRSTGVVSVCGAAIWHDPFASVITCPRCHTETGQDRRIWLARRILDVWPIDRRRRYPRRLIEVLRIPGCVTCSTPIAVEWVSATERADREPFWRPGSVACPRGCERAL